MPVKHIAFIQDDLALNGAVKVSKETAIYLSRAFGVKVTFFRFSEKHPAEEDSIFKNPLIRLVKLPDNKNPFGSVNNEVMITTIQEQSIGILFVPFPTNNFPKEIKAETDCKIGFWLHEHPLSKFIRKRELIRGIKNDPLKRQIDYFLTQWPRYYLFGNRTKKKLLSQLRSKVERYDLFITLTEGYKSFLTDRLSLTEVYQRKIFVLRNTIDRKAVDQILNKEPLMVYLGRLMRDTKQVDVLLDIWTLCARNLKNWRFEFYGKGPFEGYLHKEIANRGLKNVFVMGETSNPHYVYKKAAIVCMVSTTEGFSLSITEAQNYGCIPVAFDTPGAFREQMGNNGEYGLLIPPYNKERYSQALIDLAKDPNTMKALQNRILEHIEDFRQEVNDKVWKELLGLDHLGFQN